MLVSVNKKTNTRKPVKYSALSSGTISHVWADEDAALNAPRRQNRINLTRESNASLVQASTLNGLDA